MSEAIRTEIVASAQFTAAGNSASFSMPTSNDLVIAVDVTQYATGPVGIMFQISDDGGTTWFDYPIDISLVTTSTAAGTIATNASSIVPGGVSKWVMVMKNIAADRIRLRWTVTGSITFSATAITK